MVEELSAPAPDERAPTLEDSLELQTEAETVQAPTEDEPGLGAMFADFEQRRMVASARARLFGRARTVKIGRYRVERRLGAGAMGEVYLAHDDELGRKVAIKRVRADIANAREQQRLRREARALARLSHAHVVQVYEVGEEGGRGASALESASETYVVMEYIEGQTLGAWLGAASRPWRQILDHFLAAGRGLAAAHAAGLIHRDFKPENVLLDAEGQVRVADFGLVKAGEELSEEGGSSAARLPELGARLSVTGSVLGTVSYMSLEQLRGAQVDARSDQFAFCVALYEALWEEMPFASESVAARLAALEQGRPHAPGRTAIPEGVWRVLRRGLSRDPALRWPDMDSLLTALERAPLQRRRRRAAAAGVVAGGALTLALVVSRGAAPEPCAAVAEALDESWSPTRREALASRFAGLSVAHADDSAQRILDGLDRWASGWRSERVALCEAREAQRIDPDLSRMRGACLIRQRRSAAALVELLSEVDGDGLARAVEAVAELPAASSCATELALLGIEPAPASIHAQVEALRVDIDRAHELRLLGRLDEARALAEQAARAAAQLDYGPLRAEAEAERGKSELLVGATEDGVGLLREALDLAEAHRHDLLASRLWTELAILSLSELDAPEFGRRDLQRAEVARQRSGDEDPRYAARLEFARAQRSLLDGDEAQAEAQLRGALALLEPIEGGVREQSDYLAHLARLVASSDVDAATQLRREALSLAEQRLGPAHPGVATHLYVLADTLHRQRQEQEAAQLYERAVEIWTEIHDRPHRDLVKAHRVLAQMALRAGELDRAQAHAEQLERLSDEVLTGDQPERGDPQLLLAVIAGVRGEHRRAFEHSAAAIELWEGVLPPGDLRLERARNEAASQLIALEREAEAIELLREVIAHGQPRSLVPAYVSIAELELLGGRPQGCAAELAAIDALLEADANVLGGNEFAYRMLGALCELRSDRVSPQRVRALATARERTPLTSAQIEAWLDALGVDAKERETLGLARP